MRHAHQSIDQFGTPTWLNILHDPLLYLYHTHPPLTSHYLHPRHKQYEINQSMGDLDTKKLEIKKLKEAKFKDPVVVAEIGLLVADLDNFNLTKQPIKAIKTIELSSETRRKEISMAAYGRCGGCTRRYSSEN